VLLTSASPVLVFCADVFGKEGDVDVLTGPGQTIVTLDSKLRIEEIMSHVLHVSMK
jgi:hypothetical protein